MNWLREHWADIVAVAIVVLFFAVVVGLILWAYDGDVKCLVAECRRFK